MVNWQSVMRCQVSIAEKPVSVAHCIVSCKPKTILLKVETVEAGKIFVAISAVFILVGILTSLHHPSNISFRM
jgi:hypothetical protein